MPIIWRIAPEKVGKPLVVEASTPLIENGKTTEDVKMVLHRERKTLINAGTAVPAVRQYWNSDPRPHLTLYRGEHLLGRFEVLDLPDSKSLNLSTLCIIADGQILLSARDNRRKKFVEIRRVEP